MAADTIALTSPATPAVAHTVRRTGWTVADQAISSLTTLLALAVLARRLDAEGFGAVSIALAVCTFAVGLGRAMGTDPLVVRCSGASRTRWADATGRALGTSFGVGSISGVVALVAAAFVGDELRSSLLVAAIVLPGLAVQDGWRFAFFALGRPARAAVNDTIWTAVFLVLVFTPLATNDPSAGRLTAVWAVGGVVAALAGVVQSGRVRPRLRAAPGWLAEHRGLSCRFAIEFVLLNGSTQLVLVAVGAWQGLDGAGSLRAAALVLGPAGVIANGLLAATVPEGARLHGHRRLLGRLVPAFAVGSAVVLLGWGAAMWMLPTSWGEVLLADRWSEARPLLMPLATVYAGLIAATVFAAGLRSLGAARHSLRLIASVTVALLAGGLVGARSGATQACWGMAVPAWLGAAACGATWRHELHRSHPPTPSSAPQE